jgi:hypothetical protein
MPACFSFCREPGWQAMPTRRQESVRSSLFFYVSARCAGCIGYTGRWKATCRPTAARSYAPRSWQAWVSAMRRPGCSKPRSRVAKSNAYCRPGQCPPHPPRQPAGTKAFGQGPGFRRACGKRARWAVRAHNLNARPQGTREQGSLPQVRGTLHLWERTLFVLLLWGETFKLTAGHAPGWSWHPHRKASRRSVAAAAALPRPHWFSSSVSFRWRRGRPCRRHPGSRTARR